MIPNKYFFMHRLTIANLVIFPADVSCSSCTFRIIVLTKHLISDFRLIAPHLYPCPLARRTYSRLCLFTTQLNCREQIGSRPCSGHCPDYSTCTLTTRSRPSEYLNAIYLVSSFGDVYAQWCHLVFRHASVITEVLIG